MQWVSNLDISHVSLTVLRGRHMGDQNCVHIRVIVNEREKLAPLRELMVILSAITSIIIHRPHT